MPKDVEHSMSSNSNRYDNAQKRRRIPGACDVCKKKKVKCDSGERGGRPCTNCETTGHECTHRATTRAMGAAKGYVDNLEMRLEKMEKILTKLFPGVDLNTDLEHLVATLPPDITNSPGYPSSSESPEPSTPIPRNDEDDVAEDNDEDGVTFRLKRLQLDPSEHPYFGKSSGFQLIQTALDIKREYMEHVTGQSGGNPFKRRKREEFWRAEPWETTIADQIPVTNASSLDYPDPDLLPALINNYFNEMNIIYPMLHRPTFERQIAEDLHLRDTMFGYTVLLVCAIGAKFSDDPRVFIKGSNSTRSAGHKWFAQVNSGKSSFSEKPTLHELQMHILSICFAKSNPTAQGLWTQAGAAMRMALEVGAHRRRLRKDGRHTTEDELWKRAFWSLFAMDNIMSAISGRPCCLHEEDYDQEYPAECDDEFWEHSDPSQCFVQPENKVSQMAYFTCFLRLIEILAKVIRYVYSVRRSTTQLDRAVFKSDQQIIAELDSAMNEWMDCIPDHLRWNPNTENLLFLKQSASLHAMYYQVQIFIHRPFIPSPRNPSAITFPSLAICTNAARSCCLMLDAFIRLKQMPFPSMQAISSTAALVLLVNVLNAKRMGIATNYRRDMDLFQKVVDMLSCCEKRWGSAGRHKDILIELVSFNDLSGCPKEATNDVHGGMPLSGESQQPCLKVLLGSSTGNQDQVDMSRSVAVESNVGLVHEVNHSLPRYSAELGQLPVYQSVGFTPPMAVGGNPIQYSDIPLVKEELTGDSMFVPSFIPQGNVYHQGQAPTVGSGGMYQNQGIAPEPLWFGTQMPTQDALSIPITDWPDQAHLTEILEMMDIDNMGDWLNGNGSDFREWGNQLMGQTLRVGAQGYSLT